MFIKNFKDQFSNKFDLRSATGILCCAAPVLALALIAPGAEAATVISTVQELQNIQNNLAGSYVLGADIDASATATWNSGAGFLPIGNATSPFTGRLNGNGHIVINLFISSQAASVGLFGEIGAKGKVENVGLIGGSVAGNTTSFSPVGSLAGTNDGTILDCRAAATVTGSDNLDDPTGGLVGRNNGNITNSYASGVISGADAGGLVGDNFGAVTGSYASGNATGGSGGFRSAGGLVGNNQGSVERSYSIGNVVGTSGRIGGLVGFNEMGSIANSYAIGSVLGLIGVNVGGLVGENNGPISASYAAGRVAGTGTFAAGGLVGLADSGGTVVGGYWDTAATGQSKSAGGVGETTAELMAKLPAGFRATIWSIIPNSSYPYLKGQLLP